MKYDFILKKCIKNIPDKIKNVLKLCSTIADKKSIPIFLIGGIVRDIIIDQENFDVDITIQGNAIEFSKILKNEYPDILFIKEIHEDFKTTKVIFNIENENIELDIASTRKEIYPYPASLPVIEEIGCSIYDDIIRRDFTINSMALSLNQAIFCELIDPCNGYDDILNKKIRILHNLSFIDDPTRIIRGLKFRIRFDYELEDNTRKLQEECLNSGLFDNLVGQRIKSEIKQTFNLNKAECLNKFVEEKIYFLVDKNIVISQDIQNLATSCQNLTNIYSSFLKFKENIWLIYLGILLAHTDYDKTYKIADKLYLSNPEKNLLLESKDILSKLDLIKTAKTRFEIYEQLEKHSLESILIGLINTQDINTIKNIDLYIKELQNIKINTTGQNLIELGFSPGPLFGKILREILKAKINLEIKTFQDEKDFITKTFM